MNLFDLLVILLAILLGIAGFREGLIRGGVKLAGFLITIIILALFAGNITRFAVGLERVPHWLAVPALFFAVMLALSIFFTIIAETLHRTVHLTPLGTIDSGLGTVFGVLKGIFVAAILALILSFLPGPDYLKRQYETSRTAPKLVSLISKTIPVAAGAGMKILKYFSLPAPPERDEPQKQKHEPKLVI
ncbi:MAG: CvpA family protein [Candidatus Latescibacterota bacterium]